LGFPTTSEFCDSDSFSVFTNFARFRSTSPYVSNFKDRGIPEGLLPEGFTFGKIASKRLVEQEEATKKLSEESRKLKRNFNMAQAAIVDLEKKVTELADALRRCQDEKKIVEDGKRVAEETLENSRKELEKFQKTHDDDLKLIKNLRKDHDKSSKTAEDLRINNADLAKTLSGKEQKIQELEKALADRDEVPGKRFRISTTS
jgi:DNA repair exonuclease SbcCD ATPase subunit